MPALPVIPAETADLETLAAELKTRGYKTVLVTGEGRLPFLDVVNPAAPALNSRIYTQAGTYWWPLAETIAPASEPATAAGVIARALALRDPASE